MTSPHSDLVASSLVATKLHAPRRRREAIARPRLADRWKARHQPLLTLVAAPAGFGKTTVLTEWFSHHAPPQVSTAWLSLDAGDNDPAVFAAYLIAAMQSVAPGTAAAVPPSSQPLQSIVAAIINDLHATATDVVLVLDDYHVIDSVEIHDALGYLLDHAPPFFWLVIASRTDPPLPLARLRARGDLLEIRAADLRFTDDEAARYLNGAMGLQLGADEIDALETRTEGWVAALQLAALSMQGREDMATFIETFAGDDRFVVDYLAEEVLERQSEAVRDFLLRTSVLTRLTGPLCDAVTGGTGGRAMLEALDRANLFLVPLDDGRHWYRYHHLFADVLRARLADERPHEAAELHLRASTWHQQFGDMDEAVRHAMEGDHFERAAELVEVVGPRLRRSRQERTLRQWLEALPEAIYADRPVLAIALVGARMTTASIHGVDSLLQLVESAMVRISPPPIVFDREMYEALPVQVAVQRAGLALLTGDIDGTIAHATRALELVAPEDQLRRGSAVALLALAQWSAGDLAAAAASYAEAIVALIDADHLADMLGCSLALADIQMALGRLTEAERTFGTGLRWTADHPGLRGAADMHVGLAEVLIERNDLDGAALHLATSVELGESAGLPQRAYRWRVTMARLCRARGDLDRALELIDEAEPLFETDFSPPVRPVAALRTRVQLALGDIASARRWAGERRPAADEPLTYLREFEHITYARVLLARHDVERDTELLREAIALLGHLRTAAERGGRLGSVIEVLVLEAAAHHADRNTPAAVDALERALHLAEQDGHVRLFLHAGPAIADLLRSIASRAPAPTQVRAILAATDGRTPPAARPLTMVDGLSARELDVLRLLRSDLSGPDIARELVVSLNTVRTHTKRIYAKLGATNRREAIRRAAELGL